MNLGDYVEDATLDFIFTTRRFSSGAPYTLAGSPAVSVYKANGVTESTAGVTLTADFDSRTGMNHVRIDLSADAFYATGQDYMVVITAGTVDSVSVVGEVVATFSIENRFMRGTDGVDTSAMRGTDSAYTGTPPTAAAIRAEIDANSTQIAQVLTDLGTVDGVVDAIKAVTDNRPDGGALTSLATAAVLGAVQTAVSSVLDDTGTSGVAVSSATMNSIADHVLRRSLATARASGDGDTVSFRSLLGAISKLVNKIEVAGGNLVITEEDDTTTFGTQAVTTDAAAEPVTALDTA